MKGNDDPPKKKKKINYTVKTLMFHFLALSLASL